MVLEYEWGNPAAAAAAAMLLFGDQETSQDTGQDRAVFDNYGGHGGLGGVDFFPNPQPLTAAALFSPSSSSFSCHQRYGLALPPAAPARIGLNLGVRTYFSSALPEEEMVVGRVRQRRTRTARCQAEGCGVDLTHAKHYHRRHKVCEFHSKASIVITAGLSQRFCQQCSRFHVLAEFDQGKRSCRKRLADHNRRRRKSQDLTASTVATSQANTSTTNTNSGVTNNSAANPERVLFSTCSTTTTNNNNNNNNSNNRSAAASLAFTTCKPETKSSVTHATSSPRAPPPLPLPPPTTAPRMALGLGCGGGSIMTVPAAATGLSASSSTGTSPPSVSFLSHLAEFHGHENRFPSWDEAEEGSSIRGLFQST